MPGTDPVLPDRRSSRGGLSRVASQTSCLQCVWIGGGGVATPGSLFYADGSSGRQAHPWEHGSHHCLCPSQAVALPAICNPGHRLAVPTSRHCNAARRFRWGQWARLRPLQLPAVLVPWPPPLGSWCQSHLTLPAPRPSLLSLPDFFPISTFKGFAIPLGPPT